MNKILSRKEQAQILGSQHINKVKNLDRYVQKKQEHEFLTLKEEIHQQILQDQQSTRNALNKSTGVQFPKLQYQSSKNKSIPASLPIKQQKKKYKGQQSLSYAPSPFIKEIQDQQQSDINLAMTLQQRKKGNQNQQLSNSVTQLNTNRNKLGNSQSQTSKTFQIKEQVNSTINKINSMSLINSNRFTNKNREIKDTQEEHQYFLGSDLQQELHKNEVSIDKNKNSESSQIYSNFKLQTEQNIEMAIEDDQLLKKKRQETQELVKNSLYLKIHTRLINHVLIYSRLQYDNIFEQYTLFPDKEKSNLERQIGIENAFIKLLHNIHDHFLNETENLRNYKVTVDKNNKRMEQMKEENGMLVEQLNIAMKALSSIDLSEIKESIKKKQREENELKTENTKLQTEIIKLSNLFEQFEKNENVNSLKERIEKMQKEYFQRIKELEEQIEYKDQILKKTTQSLMSQKSQCKKLETEVQYYTQKNEDLEIQVQKLTERSKKMDIYREKMQMQVEDFIGMENKYDDQQKVMKDMQKKLKKMQDTIDKFEKKKEVGIFIPENAQFEDQKYYFQDLNKMNSLNQTFQKMGRTEIPDVDYEIVEKKLQRLQNWIEENRDSLSKDANSDNPSVSTFDVNKFTVFRPTFFTFIKQKYNVLVKSNPELMRVTIIKPEFIATLRSIMDAKYNEFLQNNNYRLYTKFGDFVYSFLGNFKIDPITQQTVINSETMYNSFASDDYRFQFYINLHANILDQTWDVVIFREFLNEDCSNDELFFYLYCRNVLFRGPQKRHHQSCFHPIHLIKWQYAERCINIVMAKYDMANIDFVENQLKKKFIKTTKDQEYMIDSGLVLRTLLEYYRAEKRSRYKLIRDLFFNQQGNSIDGRYSINFDGFRKIFENNNFPNTTELEKAQLYRECYALGKGIVSPEVFFAVCNDLNFFVKQLRFKSEKVIPKYNSELGGFEPRNQMANLFDKIHENVSQDEDTQQNIYLLQDIIQHYGNEEAYKRVEDDIFKIKHDIQVKDEDLNGRGIVWFFKRMMDNFSGIIFTEISNLGIDNNVFELEYQFIGDQMSLILEQMNELIKYIKYSKRKKDFEIKVRVSRFQRLARKKILKYYQLLNALLSTKQMMAKEGSMNV